MALYGTIINGICIIIGTCLGLFFRNIPERLKSTALQAIGLVVVLIGIQMAIQAENIIIILLSILLGGLLGASIHLEDKLNAVGKALETRFIKNGNGNLTEAFITATLIFVIGAMSIIGALDGGMRGDHELLITKGFLDGFMSLVLTSTLGYGVIFSVIPVVLYQGAIALFAVQINRWIPEAYLDLFINEITATGGLLIMVIGLNILNVTKIKIGDFLPAILLFILLFFGYHMIIS
ncbi:hypothetical protein J416_13389 [Gracilibacillus halophilus YIM-C55.5]|uniref:DUF554 domain-containing protein n=1 Tax=Gracilibacillus halophilus YIM-C55.5 TaxID=1308866 RepID=N4W9N2_9BACI|nr:DUF554 domain-containing protein [Gracilibacillus halophilus]ENH95974.1 hypothetical protein J416_13389 [Gracilibacillus halophilus YIM-C55.5]